MINYIFRTDDNFAEYTKKLISINNDYDFQDSKIAFGSLSKINIFIGENNSGKSRFLRHLYKTPFYGFSKEGYVKFYQLIEPYIRISQYDQMQFSLKEFNEIYNQIGTYVTRISNKPNNFFSNLLNISVQVASKNKFYFPVLRGIKDYKSIINNKLNRYANSAKSIQNKDSINHYISLLNLESSGLEEFDIYREIIAHEYFKDSEDLTGNILTGGKLYKEIKSMLLGDESQRKLVNEFQIFLKENFFCDYDNVQLIPREKEKVLYVRIGKIEKPIYDWGDGTQQLIVILFSLFKYKDCENYMFFIEEPEMYLHPGILRKFIEVISSDIFKNHQYFITTHSCFFLIY